MTTECHKITYELTELSKVKKRPIDFNVTEYKKFLGIVSGLKLQLNFKKPSLVEFLLYQRSAVT